MTIEPIAAIFIHLPLERQIALNVNLWRAEEENDPDTWAEGFTKEEAIQKLEDLKRRKGMIGGLS